MILHRGGPDKVGAIPLPELCQDLIGQGLIAHMHIPRIGPEGNREILLEQNVIETHGGHGVLPVVKAAFEGVHIAGVIPQRLKVIHKSGQVLAGLGAVVGGTGTLQRGVGSAAQHLVFRRGCAAAKSGHHNAAAAALALHPAEVLIDLGRHGEALHPVEVKVGFAHHHDHIGLQARAGLGLVGSQQLPHFGRGGPFIGEIVVIQRADQAVDGAELPFLLAGEGTAS